MSSGQVGSCTLSSVYVKILLCEMYECALRRRRRASASRRVDARPNFRDFSRSVGCLGFATAGSSSRFFPKAQEMRVDFSTFRRAPSCGRARIAAEGMDGWRRHQRRNRAARSSAHFPPSRRGPHSLPRDATAARIGGSRRPRTSPIHTPVRSRTRGARGSRRMWTAHWEEMRAGTCSASSSARARPRTERPRRQRHQQCWKPRVEVVALFRREH